MTTTAIFGVGKLGGALVRGLLRGGVPAKDLRLVDTGHHVAGVAVETGVAVASPADALRLVELIVIAVKPMDVGALLAAVAPDVDPARHLVMSVAAGLPTTFYEQRLPAGTPVVRTMPNTPLLVGEGMTALSGGAAATDAHLAIVESLLAPVSRVVRVREDQLDAVTALSGTGPAYFFLVMEVLADAGVLLGLPRALALELITQTAFGAAMMARDGVDNPAELRHAVSSPAGTTIAGIRILEDRGFRAALIAAAEGARDRSAALSAQV